MITERERFLMREAMKAGSYLQGSNLDAWLNERIDDVGHTVADRLGHDANVKFPRERKG